MLRSTLGCAGTVLLVVALSSAVHQTAGAQTQMQGKTLGAQPNSPAPPKKLTPKEKRAECTSKGKGQGLKGRDLTKFVRECVEKSD
jgi:hypothetical protein